MKSTCRCGARLDSEKGEVLHSYFSKANGMRVTVCDSCSEVLGLNDESKFTKVPYDKNVNNLTPIRHAD